MSLPVRALVLAGFLLLALAATPANAAANVPPVAQASASPGEAVLGQLVTFTDLSTDTDGTIVRSVWTFTDGRDVVGTTVLRAFDYPGVHTIGLRVTDNDGASATTEIQVLVRAPLMRGHATGVGSGAASFADTGDVATTQQTTTRADAAAASFGQLRAAGLDAEVRTVSDRAIATASVAYVYIPVPIGYILATGVETEALATCSGTTIAAKFTQLRLNDAPLVPPGEVPQDTRIDLPGGIVIELNVHTSSEGLEGATAMRVLVPGQAPVEIAHAIAGVAYCRV